MALTTILEETTVSGFADVGDGSAYYAILETSSSVFAVGETYSVHWDGTEHELTAFDNEGSVLVAYESESGEGFAIINMEDAGNYGLQIMTNSSNTSHTLAIYQGTEDEETGDDTTEEETPEGIVLLDRANTPGTYTNNVLRVPTADGGTKDFTEGTAVEKTVELDFSGGGMTVTPGAGELFNKVMIPVPAGLSEEIIPEGMTVAGIVGTKKDRGAVIKHGSFTGDGGVMTIAHNLGVVPDVVVLNTTSGGGSGYLIRAFGISEAFYQLTGFSKQLYAYINSTGSTYTNSRNATNEGTSDASVIKNATAENITFGSSTYPLKSGYKYQWLAIGGLT